VYSTLCKTKIVKAQETILKHHQGVCRLLSFKNTLRVLRANTYFRVLRRVQILLAFFTSSVYSAEYVIVNTYEHVHIIRLDI
jgi:hypothetical protein